MSNPPIIDKLLEVMGRIEAAPDTNTVTELLNDHLRPIGIQYFMIAQLGGLVQGERLIAGTYNEKWVERFVRKRYDFKDPTIRAILESRSAFSIGELKRSQVRGSKGWKIMNEAAEFGIADGWGFTVTGPNGYISGVSFTGREIDDAPDKQSALRLLGLFTHAKLLSLLSQSVRSPPPLTQRERDALAFVAVGRTDDEIADTMGVSAATARMHIDNAKMKLGTTKRTCAVVEALRYGQICI